MRGERVSSGRFELSGMAGDRRYAVASTAAPVGKPLVTSRERTQLLLYEPRLEPSPIVVTPEGLTFPLPSEALIGHLQQRLAAPGAVLQLQHSPERPLVDVRAVSLVSRATLDLLEQELGPSSAPQRLRNNLILSLDDPAPFAEEALEGRQLRFGDLADAPVLRVHERVPRCRIVTLDPVTAEADPALLRYLAKQRAGRVAMYATVVRAGGLSEGVPVFLT